MTCNSRDGAGTVTSFHAIFQEKLSDYAKEAGQVINEGAFSYVFTYDA